MAYGLGGSGGGSGGGGATGVLTITSTSVLGATAWNKRLIFNSATPIIVTFPQQSTLTTPVATQGEFENIGAGTVTLAIQGAEAFTIGSNTTVATGASGSFFRDTTTTWQIMGGTSIDGFQIDTLLSGSLANATYPGPNLSFAGTITSVVTKCRTGTATLDSNVNGGASMATNSISTTKNTQTASSNNTFAAGGVLNYVISANSSCADAMVTVSGTKLTNI